MVQSHEIAVIVCMVLESELHLLKVVEVSIDELIAKAKPLKVCQH